MFADCKLPLKWSGHSPWFMVSQQAEGLLQRRKYVGLLLILVNNTIVYGSVKSNILLLSYTYIYNDQLKGAIIQRWVLSMQSHTINTKQILYFEAQCPLQSHSSNYTLQSGNNGMDDSWADIHTRLLLFEQHVSILIMLL